jgi:hypothetical protein
MKLYLISQDENADYDAFDSAVVCAPDEETARRMDPNGLSWATADQPNGRPCDFSRLLVLSAWCSTPDAVKVRYLGEGAEDMTLGVVCASFNAG